MSYTLGQPIIDLGSYGKLIFPVKVDGGKWFYIWDRTGDGTVGTSSPNFDAVSHDILDSIFTQNSSGQERVTSGNTDDTFRFATLNNVRVALPTLGSSIDAATPHSVLFGGNFDPGAARYFQSTVVGSADKTSGSDQTNGTYDDLLAIWDAFNGIGITIGQTAGFPANWPNNFLWSSTTVVAWDGSVGHVMVGRGGDAYANVDTAQTLVVLEVFATTSPAPTYSIASNQPSVNEGSSATFTLTTTNVATGTSVPYTLSGISAADISGGSLSGNAVVNSSGAATISVTLLNDSLTEGAETLTVTAGGATASTVVNDTSVAAIAQYQLNATSTSVDEGGFTQFILYTKNVAIGTTINYTLAGTGITSADIVGGSLSGTAVVASASFNGFTGGANINIYIAADNFTEGAESLEVYSQGQSSNILIKDTSKTLSPTYSLQSLTGGVRLQIV